MGYKKIGEYLEMIRKKGNVTQEELGVSAGITRQAVSSGEKKNTFFGAATYISFSDKLDVSIDDLLRSGRRRETELYKFSRLSAKDMSLKAIPSEPDPLGNTLLDYILESNDVEKFDAMASRGVFNYPITNNLKVIEFLIRNNQPEKLKKEYRNIVRDQDGTLITNYMSGLEFPILEYYLDYEGDTKKSFNLKYYQLSRDKQRFIDTIFKCNNPSVLDAIPYRPCKVNNYQLPFLFYMAIEMDHPWVVRHFISETGQSFNQLHFDMAIESKSTKVAKLIYEHRSFDMRRNLVNLKRIADKKYVHRKMKELFPREFETSKSK